VKRPWITNLVRSQDRARSAVCCGLDLDVAKLPRSFSRGTMRQRVLAFAAEVVRITYPYVSSYKVQKAFLEWHDRTPYAELVSIVRGHAPGVPIILDCKVGDIGNSMGAYLETYLGQYGFDAVILNPYMGADAWSLLARWPACAGVVVCRSSNPAGSKLQSAQLIDGRPVWALVLEEVTAAWSNGATLFPIMSSLDRASLRRAAEWMPSGMPLFVAGVGAEGGSPGELRADVGSARRIIVNSSRDLVFPFEPSDDSWRDRIEQAASRMQLALGA
jgi:orotidine-5'-phosphate decarboxylase